jgi:hypothetical protein
MDKHTLKVAMIIHAKYKQNNNRKSISIAIETAKCLALHHISTKNGNEKKEKKA